MSKPSAIQVGRSAEHFVVAEIHRRGGWAACFGGNMPKIDVLATDVGQTRTVTIQVKAKFGGSAWQTSITRGRRWSPQAFGEDVGRFWVLVDLRQSAPGFYVMPERWIENDIASDHAAYLAAHGGVRPGNNPNSTHHAIQTTRVEQWLERWDLLGIFAA